MATGATRLNGAQITSSVACPVASGAGGLWWDGNTTGPLWRKADGTDVTLGAGGGGSTGNWTFSSNAADLNAANAMTIAATTAASLSLGRSGINVLLPGGVIRASTPGANTAGVSFTIGLNNGGTAGGGAAAGAAGANTFTSGQGGSATTTASETATAGGQTLISGGQGGTGAASTNGPGNGGLLLLVGGTAGSQTSGFGSSNGGGVTIRGAAGVGGGTAGVVNIGATNTSAVNIGASGITTTIASPLALSGTSVTVTASSVVGGDFKVLDGNNSGLWCSAGNVILQVNGTARTYLDSTGAFRSFNGTETIGSASSYWAGVYSKRYINNLQSVAAAGTLSIDPSAGGYIRIALSSTAITSLTIQAGVTDGEQITVEVVQDATGSRTIPTTWTNVAFAGGTYTATTTANKHDCISLIYNSTLAKWVERAARALNMS